MAMLAAREQNLDSSEVLRIVEESHMVMRVASFQIVLMLCCMLMFNIINLY